MENRTELCNRKRWCREQLLTARKALSKEERRIKSEQICARILQLPVFMQAETIFGYVPVRGEVDVMPLLEAVLNRKKNLALPRCLDRQGHMAFFKIRSFSELTPGSFHIPEPREGLEELRPSDGLMLVPGVGFDMKGGRLGYGGGYYDRFIGAVAGISYLAPAYELQILDALPMESHDRCVDLVVTEHQIIEREYGG